MPRNPGELDHDYYDRYQKTYFDWHHEVDSDEFWRRVAPLDFHGKRVLEIGCGDGALALNIADRGASFVLGVDIDKPRIEFAMRNLQQRFPSYLESIELRYSRAEDVREQFDIVVSKDAMEHIDNPQLLVDAVHQLLRPGGLALFGFGPLYYSPFGDHGRYFDQTTLPWLPAFVPHWLLFKIATRVKKHAVRSLVDVELNGITPAGFRALFQPDRWEFIDIAYNRGSKRLLPTLSLLRRLPGLEKFFTVNIYAIIKRR